MSTQISIRIPRAVVSPGEFAELEGIKRRTAYSWCEKGLLPIQPKKNAHSRTKIYYAQYKQKQLSESLGHSRFEIVIGE
ncbi:Rha family transcriptional regulator [Serratia ureilytica]|uniref:Rha family transcriptional regulator n=1 Tax=Serratia ureilytica TaxID=300181 RepID=UPI003FA6ACCB